VLFRSELPDTLAEKIGCLIRPILQPTRAADDRRETADPDLQSRWQTVLAQLASWKSNPNQVADEGVLPPLTALLASAENVAEVLLARGVEPPDNLLTNGDGGIVFRWRLPGRTWSIELDVDGSIESSLMAGSRLLWRHSLHDHPLEAS
jgi:hypothetical protein